LYFLMHQIYEKKRPTAFLGVFAILPNWIWCLSAELGLRRRRLQKHLYELIPVWKEKPDEKLERTRKV
jgi:hypothetical protein